MVRLSDRPSMTSDVDELGRNTTTQQQEQRRCVSFTQVNSFDGLIIQVFCNHLPPYQLTIS